MSLRSRYGVVGWPASMAMSNTCALCLRTSPAFPFSVAVGQRLSPQLSNLGYSRTLTAVLASWRSATRVYSGWWHYGLIAMPSPASSTSRWSGLFRQSRRCRLPTWWNHMTPGCCGTVWEILRSIQKIQETTRRRITLISAKWRGSSRRWKATSTDISDWISQQEGWVRSPQR